MDNRGRKTGNILEERQKITLNGEESKAKDTKRKNIYTAEAHEAKRKGHEESIKGCYACGFKEHKIEI